VKPFYPSARVHYVNADSTITASLKGKLPRAGLVSAFTADVRDAPALIRRAKQRVDLSLPTAFVLARAAHYFADHHLSDLLAALGDATAPGSALVLVQARDIPPLRDFVHPYGLDSDLTLRSGVKIDKILAPHRFRRARSLTPPPSLSEESTYPGALYTELLMRPTLDQAPTDLGAGPADSYPVAPHDFDELEAQLMRARLDEWPPDTLAACIALRRTHPAWMFDFLTPSRYRRGRVYTASLRNPSAPIRPHLSPLEARDPDALSVLIRQAQTALRRRFPGSGRNF
jgi:hypothetical protein